MDLARYARQVALPDFSESDQYRLSTAAVLVIGAGGLGCPVIQQLAGSGVGQIDIIDGDQIEISNLPRQLLFRDQHIGQPKATIAAEQCRALNPRVLSTAYPVYLDQHYSASFFDPYDVLVDATDTFQARYLINDLAVAVGKTVVSGALFQYEGQVTTYNHKGGPTYRCLFPNESKVGFGCAISGVLNPLTNWIGSMMSMDILNVLLERETLSGCLVLADAKRLSIQKVRYQRDGQQIERARNNMKNQAL